jgi:hypothetical protein
MQNRLAAVCQHLGVPATTPDLSLVLSSERNKTMLCHATVKREGGDLTCNLEIGIPKPRRLLMSAPAGKQLNDPPNGLFAKRGACVKAGGSSGPSRGIRPLSGAE